MEKELRKLHQERQENLEVLQKILGWLFNCCASSCSNKLALRP
jgi:hypothetical protein